MNTSFLQQALGAHQAGNLAEAERLYREVLGMSPDHPDALALLGVVLDAKGDPAQAVTYIQRAIQLDPNAALFRVHHGNALTSGKRYAEAVEAFRAAIELKPDMAEAHFNLGNALRKMDDWQGAIAEYNKSVALNPQYPEVYNNLALAMVHENKFPEAMEFAKKSVAIAPDFGEAWLTLCSVAETVKDFDTAVVAGERVVKLLPQNHKAWFGYGVALNRVKRNEEAVKIYHQALTLNPDRADIWDNLGQTYQSLNKLEEAEAIFRKMIDVSGQTIKDEETREVAEEEYGNRHWHLALMELLRGKYKQGFARYRARFMDIGDLKRPTFSQPLWRGESLSGKTLLVGDEQGFGDTIMFARYLPLIKAQGGRVIFSVHKVLEPLFRGWSGVDEVVMHGQPVTGLNYHAATFDLPHRFGTTLHTIPQNVPYLPQLTPDADTLLPPPTKPGLKIGVVWGGSPLHKNDENRSIPLRIFSELFKLPGAQFYSLNRDMKEGDAELLPQLPVINLAPKLRNFADAARYMNQLDLIITCDTATAHLAGGLGKPVWTLISFAPDWRWMLDRGDSPWYPTMRLFRQPAGGDWASCVALAKDVLAQELAVL